MRGRTVRESTYHVAKLFIDLFAAVTGDGERFVHDVRAMVSNGAGGELHAITHDVVLIGENLERIFGFERFQTTLRH